SAVPGAQPRATRKGTRSLGAFARGGVRMAIKALCIGIAFALPFPSASAAEVAGSPRRAEFALEQPSRDARQLADWVVDSGANPPKTFGLVDNTKPRQF